MYNKKKIATLLVIGMAAMFMMNGCQKKASETETTKQTTAQKVLHRPKQPQHIPQRAIHFLLIFRILHGWRQRKALRINGHL